jgi:hypothetical protein
MLINEIMSNLKSSMNEDISMSYESVREQILQMKPDPNCSDL